MNIYRRLVWLLVVCLVLCALPVQAQAEHTATLPGTAQEDDFWSDGFGSPEWGDGKAMLRDSEGGVYVPFYSGASAYRIAYWDGAAWTEIPGTFNDEILSLALDADENLYAGGKFTTVDGATTVNGVARWDGAAWLPLGSGLVGEFNGVYAMAIDAANHLYVTGRFTTAGGVIVNHVARWDGAAWHALGDGLSYGGTAYGYAILTQGSNLFVGGLFTHAGGAPAPYIARWDGTGWHALGSSVDYTVRALADDGHGGIYVGGEFGSAGGATAKEIAHWDGATWSPVGSGFDSQVVADRVTSLLMTPGGGLYAGGLLLMDGSRYFAAFWDGDTWTPLVEGTQNTGTSVYALALDRHNRLLTTGDFTVIGGIAAQGLAFWDGAGWQPLGYGMYETYTGDDVKFMGNVGGELYMQATANAMWRWTGHGWAPAGWRPGGQVYTMAADSDGNLYVGGDIAVYNGETLIARYLAKWDGVAWSPLGSGVNHQVFALAVDTNDNLYVGGRFTTAGGTAANHVALWNGAAWQPLGDGSADWVYALTMTDQGALYAGVASNGVAQWNGANWVLLALGSSTIRALAWDAGQGRLYAGGAGRLASWNGATWTSFANDFSVQVNTLTLDHAGNLFAGGLFANLGGVAVQNIARWDGVGWNALDAGANAIVNHVVVDSAGNLFAGGRFTTMGGKPASLVAAAWLAPYPVVSKRASPAVLAPGEFITFTVEVHNRGMLTATQVVISDTIPMKSTLDATSLGADATVEGEMIRWQTALDLAPGASVTRTFRVTANRGPLVVNRAHTSVANVLRAADSNGVQVFVAPGIAALINAEAGGNLVFTDAQDNPTTVQAPPGAVEQPTFLALTPLAEAAPPPGWEFAFHAFNLDAFIAGLKQSGFLFQQPVLITIVYSARDVAGLDAGSLALFTWNQGAAQWEDAACGAVARDPAARTIATPVCHLSRFALFAMTDSGEQSLYLPVVSR